MKGGEVLLKRMKAYKEEERGGGGGRGFKNGQN